MKSPLFRRILVAVALLAVLVAVVPGLRLYRYIMTHVSTDDAYVDGDVSLVAPRIPGTVAKLYVGENWNVSAGQLLLTLDPRDYQVRVDQAQATLERARQTIDEQFAELHAARAGLALAESQLRQARIDYNRAKALRDQQVVSREFYDQATTALRVALADRELAAHQVNQVLAELGGDTDSENRYNRPLVKQAAASLAAAKLDLSYTELRAAFSGIITHKNVDVGDRVQAGQPLMAIVPVKGLYVTANFKETELTDVRVGQQAEMTADIYPGYVYSGHVDSIAMGTGAAFALLPPENATGNWVKVVQRVPVKVVLNRPAPPDKPLRMGLSVEVSVDVSDTSGPLLTSTIERQYERRKGAAPYEEIQGQKLTLPPTSSTPALRNQQPLVH